MVLSQIYGLIYGHSKFAINFTMSYMIVKRVLKIDLEIAEILEVKVSSFNIEIVFLPLKKIILKLKHTQEEKL